MLNERIKKFRLGVYCPRGDDATSLVRAMGPLAAMEREDGRLELLRPALGPEGQELTWDWLARCDGLLVQRPWLQVHAQLMVQARLMGVPVWVDWDDDYLSIHPSNPHYEKFAFEGAGELLKRMTNLAEVVTVTTGELKRRRERDLERGRQIRRPKAEPSDRERGNIEHRTSNIEHRTEEWADKVRVVPNACHWPFSQNPRTRRVSWRGGASHVEDLLPVLPVLGELARLPQFSTWEWCFLGDAPWQVREWLPAERLVGGFGADPWLYMGALSRLSPWVHVVPLAVNSFNRCKSNLAWIEATAAGAAVLAPGGRLKVESCKLQVGEPATSNLQPATAGDWAEWERPGIVHYDTVEAFGRNLRNVMEQFSEEAPLGCVRDSRRYIQEELMLERVNELRWDILNEFWARRNGIVPPGRD